MEVTYDPEVFIEEERQGYIRYRRLDGRRWEVHGVCDYRGNCVVGAINHPMGPKEGRLDVPVTPEFRDCCPFIFVELEAHADHAVSA